MKNDFNFARLVVVIFILLALVMASLSIFGVLSVSILKDSLTKMTVVSGLIITTAALIAVVTGRQK